MAHQFKNHVKYQQNNQQITVAILKFLAEQGLVLCAVMKFCSLPGILIVISQSDFHQEIKYNYCPVASFTPCIRNIKLQAAFEMLRRYYFSLCGTPH
jgi:hypothetical protein